MYNKQVIRKALELYEKHYFNEKEMCGYAGKCYDGGYSEAMKLKAVFETMWMGNDLPLNNIPKFLHNFLYDATILVTKKELENNPEYIQAKKLYEKYKQYL